MYQKVFLVFSILIISQMSFSQQLERMVLENWESGVWVNRMQERLHYNAQGRLIGKEIAHWNPAASEWENQTKVKITHTEGGVELMKETFKWDAPLSTWLPSKKESYSLNDQDKPSYVLTETHDGSSWRNTSMDEYVYDADGRLLYTQLNGWDASSESWKARRKYEYQIELGQKQGFVVSFWEDHANEWQLYKRARYRYESGEVHSIEFDSWKNAQWSFHSRRKNLRSEKNELNAIQVDLFVDDSSKWEKSTQVDYQYTDFGKISMSTSKKWQPKTANWEHLQRSTYYYSTQGEVITASNQLSEDMELFPNPATDKLTIRPLPKGVLLVHDAHGKVLVRLDNSEEEIQLDVIGWEIGVYSVQINGTEVRKFVKQ